MRSVQMRTDQIRDAVAKTARMLAKDDIKVTQIGAQAFCEFDTRNGKVKRINLPVIPDEPTEEFLIALQGFLDHELGHAFHTNGMEKCRPTYTDEDGNEKKVDLHGLTNIVEDVRIEREQAKLFKGTEANLEGLREFMINAYWGKWLGQVQAAALAPDEKERRMRTLAFVPYIRARGGQKRCERWMNDNGLWPLFEELDRRIPDLADRLKALKSTADSLELAKVINDALKPPPAPPKQDKDEEGDSDQPAPNLQADPDMEPEADGVPGDEKDQGEGAQGKEPDLDEIDFGKEGEMGDLGAQPEQDADEKDQGGSGGEEQDDTDREGEGSGDPDEGDKDAGDGDGKGGKGSDEDGEGDADGDEEDDVEGEDDEEGEGVGDDDDDAEFNPDNVPSRGKTNTLREAMKHLNAEQRRALFLYNRRKQTVEQIADRLGKSTSETVSILGEARRRLNKAVRM